MKNLLIILLLLATAALASFCVVEARHASQQRAQAAAQQAAAEQKAQELATLQQAQEKEDQQRRELLRRSDELVAQARAEQSAVSNQLAAKLAQAAPEAQATNAGPDASSMGSMLSKMMSDPETKKMIRESQRMMMAQLYAPLIKQLGLSPDEATKFKEMLLDHTAAATEQATSLFGATNRTQLTSQLAEQQKSFDEQLKAFLGDDRFAQYQEYQQTVGQRTQLSLFKQQLGADNPLSDQQTEQLLTFMKEEQKNMGPDPFGAKNDPANFEAMLSPDKLQQFLDNQSQVNQKVYDRAKDLLSPDQLEAFGTFQTNQLNMMKLGMSMAAKMFKPAGNSQ